jgi:hypothetical protein
LVLLLVGSAGAVCELLAETAKPGRPEKTSTDPRISDHGGGGGGKRLPARKAQRKQR